MKILRLGKVSWIGESHLEKSDEVLVSILKSDKDIIRCESIRWLIESVANHTTTVKREARTSYIYREVSVDDRRGVVVTEEVLYYMNCT